jgi:predicted aldo/keto reductase-like oxidoreductase
MLMFSVNPAFDMLPFGENVFDHLEKGFDTELFRGIDPKRAELYTLCQRKQIGITVMKAFGAGKLLSAQHTPFAGPLTAAQCIHYALSRPAVASVLPGCQTAAEMKDAARYFSLDAAERDYAGVIGAMRNDFRGSCVYCSHCQPCPSGIDIAAVNKYLDIARLDPENIPPSIRSHYAASGRGESECVECGHCEKRCPFGVPVIENIKEAERVLGTGLRA